MAYSVKLDDVELPITPSKIQMKIKNRNKTISLIDGSEINILKSPGLTEINFEALLPNVPYPFRNDSGNFHEAEYYLEKLKALKDQKKFFRFLCSRTSPSGKLMYDTDLDVSLEDYQINEDASEGQDVIVSIRLKQYRKYETQKINMSNREGKTIAKVKEIRSNESRIKVRKYTVKSGDTLWNIAKEMLGDGSKYTEIAKKNHIANTNLILVGQVLMMPE